MLAVLYYQMGWKIEGDTVNAPVKRYQWPMAQEISRVSVFATAVVLRFSVYVSLAMAFSTISESHMHFWKTTCWMSKCSPLAGAPQALLVLNERQNCYGLDDQCSAAAFLFDPHAVYHNICFWAGENQWWAFAEMLSLRHSFGWNAVQFSSLGEFGARMFNEKALKEEGLLQDMISSCVQSYIRTYIYRQSSWQIVFNLYVKGKRS